MSNYETFSQLAKKSKSPQEKYAAEDLLAGWKGDALTVGFREAVQRDKDLIEHPEDRNGPCFCQECATNAGD